MLVGEAGSEHGDAPGRGHGFVGGVLPAFGVVGGECLVGGEDSGGAAAALGPAGGVSVGVQGSGEAFGPGLDRGDAEWLAGGVGEPELQDVGRPVAVVGDGLGAGGLVQDGAAAAGIEQPDPGAGRGVGAVADPGVACHGEGPGGLGEEASEGGLVAEHPLDIPGGGAAGTAERLGVAVQGELGDGAFQDGEGPVDGVQGLWVVGGAVPAEGDAAVGDVLECRPPATGCERRAGGAQEGGERAGGSHNVHATTSAS